MKRLFYLAGIIVVLGGCSKKTNHTTKQYTKCNSKAAKKKRNAIYSIQFR